MSELRDASLWLWIEPFGYRTLSQTSIFSHITFPNWGHFTHLFIFTPILDSWTHFPVENHLFFWMTWGWSYPFTFHGIFGGKLVSFTNTIGCQLQTFQFRTPAKPVALPSWACMHGSYQRKFGLRGVCFSQFGLTHAHCYLLEGILKGFGSLPLVLSHIKEQTDPMLLSFHGPLTSKGCGTLVQHEGSAIANLSY